MTTGRRFIRVLGQQGKVAYLPEGAAVVEFHGDALVPLGSFFLLVLCHPADLVDAIENGVDVRAEWRLDRFETLQRAG